MSTVPFISQLKSLWQAITGDLAGAKKTQEEFLDAWENHPGQQISEMADNIPVVGHIKGVVHLALGDTEAAIHSEEAATRTLVVVGAGALTAGTGGAAAPILAGVVAGVAADAAVTGIESARHQKYEPQGYLNAVSEFKSDWRGSVFDVVALGAGDAVLAADGSVTKAKAKTTKVFRVEGEGIFLTGRGMLQRGANSRIFPGPGGSVIESPNILKLVVPSDQENRPVRPKRPAVLCLNVGDPARAETYYAQKLLQYREAADKLRSENPATASDPAAFQFEIKSFRILTSDAKQMLREIPKDGSPSPDGVRRVDITKTSVSFECPQPVYTPLIEKAIPDTFREVQPAWLLHLPSRFLAAMRDHQVAYGRVRTFVIVTAKFGKEALASNVAQKISNQDLARLTEGAVPLSLLSEQGVNNVEIREEPVVRLRQSREVKCGRTVLGDVNHGKYMQYLAEFSNGSTEWIPSRNVAEDLKEEFWDVITKGAKEVAEVISSDPSTGKVTVSRPDGTTDVVDQTQIFWQQELNPTRLSDGELEALLFHGHHGVDVNRSIPVTVSVKSDWAKVEMMSDGVMIIKDPRAEKAGIYDKVQFDERSMRIGQEGSQNHWISQDIPFYILNSGAAFDIKVTHGADGSHPEDRQGSVIVSLPDENFESRVNTSNIGQNTSTFHIRPIIFTPGLLSVETDWAQIEITSKDATIGPDPTVDQMIYKNVKFTPTKMKLSVGHLREKTVVPFVFLTRDEQVDITITHGRDKDRLDSKGTASALFAQNTYTSASDTLDIVYNTKKFKKCPVNARSPVIMM